MGTLFEEFQILCIDYDYILWKSGDIIQGRTLFKEIRYICIFIFFIKNISTVNAFIIYDIFLESVKDILRFFCCTLTIALFQRRKKTAEVDFTKAFEIHSY